MNAQDAKRISQETKMISLAGQIGGTRLDDIFYEIRAAAGEGNTYIMSMRLTEVEAQYLQLKGYRLEFNATRPGSKPRETSSYYVCWDKGDSE